MSGAHEEGAFEKTFRVLASSQEIRCNDPWALLDSYEKFVEKVEGGYENLEAEDYLNELAFRDYLEWIEQFLPDIPTRFEDRLADLDRRMAQATYDIPGARQPSPWWAIRAPLLADHQLRSRLEPVVRNAQMFTQVIGNESGYGRQGELKPYSTNEPLDSPRLARVALVTHHSSLVHFPPWSRLRR